MNKSKGVILFDAPNSIAPGENVSGSCVQRSALAAERPPHRPCSQLPLVGLPARVVYIRVTAVIPGRKIAGVRAVGAIKLTRGS